MKWPLISRQNGVDRARYEQVIDQRDEARSEAARHVCKIVELCAEIDALREQHQPFQHADGLTSRLHRALRACAGYRADAAQERRRADRLQQRLDDALGLNTSKVLDGRLWQHTRHDKKTRTVS
jgi:hypothetical protein